MENYPKLIVPEQMCPNGHPMSDVDGILRLDGDKQRVTKATCVTCSWAGLRLVHDYEILAKERGISVEDAIKIKRGQLPANWKPPQPTITEPLPGQLPPEADAALAARVAAGNDGPGAVVQADKPEGGKSLLEKGKEILGIE